MSNTVYNVNDAIPLSIACGRKYEYDDLFALLENEVLKFSLEAKYFTIDDEVDYTGLYEHIYEDFSSILITDKIDDIYQAPDCYKQFTLNFIKSFEVKQGVITIYIGVVEKDNYKHEYVGLQLQIYYAIKNDKIGFSEKSCNSALNRIKSNSQYSLSISKS
jgi:hypothetical protein